jgi:site-specific DNA recombinase
LCDGGKVVLRARFRLQLASLIPDVGTRTVLQKPLEKTLEIDLFDMPQRALHREAIQELRGLGLTEREAAQRLGLTITAAQNAAALQRLMDKMGITDPYLPVVEPPSEGKLRRHKHKRYHFEPLDGAGEI